jgi:hypothetical protein
VFKEKEMRSSDAPVERHASTISVLLRWMAHETRGRDGSQAIPFPPPGTWVRV